MRLSEIKLSNPPSMVLITREFDRDYREFAAQNPDVVPSKLLAFCRIKINNEPITGDDMFTGAPLTGYRHYQVITGKCILIYRQVNSGLRLFELVEHNEYEGRRQHHLAARLDKYSKSSDSDLIQIDPEQYFSGKEPEPELTDADIDEVNDLVYYLISEGLHILKLALEKNDWGEFFDLVSGHSPESVFTAFGGVEKFKTYIKDLIKQYGRLADYNEI